MGHKQKEIDCFVRVLKCKTNHGSLAGVFRSELCSASSSINDTGESLDIVLSDSLTVIGGSFTE